MDKKKLFHKAVDIGAAGIAIGMKVFLTLKSPAPYSNEWLHSLTEDELGIETEKVKLQKLRKDKKAEQKLRLLTAEKKRREQMIRGKNR